MGRVEKTVFISYRRPHVSWALAIFQNLTHHGYDVFFDFSGVARGDFESVILGNICARAHFLVMLTPSALEHCSDALDWLRREIEAALGSQRNIVPLMLEGFDFGTPGISRWLTGTMASLKRYNALAVPAEHFDEALDRLREKYLHVPLDAVLHPVSPSARQAAKHQQVAAGTAPAVLEKELTAQEWFERGYSATDLDEKLRHYSQAIRLKPDYAHAFTKRGLARQAKGDVEGALQDHNEAIRLKPDYGDAFLNRGLARKAKGDLEGALQDCNEVVRLDPDYALAYYNRGVACHARGDLEGALWDYSEAIRLKRDYANTYYNRAKIWQKQGNYKAAIADFLKYLDEGGGMRNGDHAEVQQTIRDLGAKKFRANKLRAKKLSVKK